MVNIVLLSCGFRDTNLRSTDNFAPGIWDALSPEAVVRHIHEMIPNDGGSVDLPAICESICREQSTAWKVPRTPIDNCTVMIVDLQHFKRPHPAAAEVAVEKHSASRIFKGLFGRIN